MHHPMEITLSTQNNALAGPHTGSFPLGSVVPQVLPNIHAVDPIFRT